MSVERVPIKQPFVNRIIHINETVCGYDAQHLSIFYLYIWELKKCINHYITKIMISAHSFRGDSLQVSGILW